MSAPAASPIPGAQPPSGAEPVDPTVLELLQGSALAPMLDMPVNDILHNLGLPDLPELSAFGPLPDMPPLPVIDLSALIRPLTDLASAFGTGQIGAPAPAPAPAPGPEGAPAAAPPADPTQMLAQVSTVMQTVMQVGSSALQALMTLWQSQAATQAGEKAGQAQTDAAKLEAQSIGEKQHLLKGATSVAIGGAETAVVIGAFTAKLALSPLYLGAPGGQAFLVASAIEASTEALAITAKTKAELGIEGAQLTQTGEKVKITDAPTGVDSMEQLTQLVGMITPLIGTASEAAQSVGKLAAANPALSASKPLEDTNNDGGPNGSHLDDAKGGPGSGGLGAGGIAGAPAPLGAFPGAKMGGPGPLGAVGAFGGAGGLSGSGAGLSSVANAAGNSSSSSHGPGYMPMGGAGMAGAAGMARDGESVTDGSARGAISAEHGAEVVGPIEGIAVPVVGGTESTQEPPPDKELTL